MGSTLAIAPRPLVVKVTNPGIISPAAQALAFSYATVEMRIAPSPGVATATHPPQAFSQRTLYPSAASATTGVQTPAFSQRTLYPPAGDATAAPAIPTPVVRPISAVAAATASRGAVIREERAAHAALASGVGIRSAFDGPNENPLSEGSRWTLSSGSNLQRIAGNAKPTSVANGSHHMRFTDMPDIVDMEVVAQLAVVPASNAVDVALIGRQGATNGYALYLPGPTQNRIRIYRTASNSTLVTQLIDSGVSITLQAGMWLRLRCQGSRISAWYRMPGDADWTLATEVTDTAVTNAGKAGLRIYGSAATGPQFSAFGAWALPIPVVKIAVPTPASAATASRTPPAVVIS